MLLFGTLHSNGYIFPFLLCLLHLFFSQLFVRPPQTAILPFCISFSWDGLDPCLLYNVTNLCLKLRGQENSDFVTKEELREGAGLGVSLILGMLSWMARQGSEGDALLCTEGSWQPQREGATAMGELKDRLTDERAEAH